VCLVVVVVFGKRASLKTSFVFFFCLFFDVLVCRKLDFFFLNASLVSLTRSQWLQTCHPGQNILENS
jgi:hypothetical protein